MRLFAVGPGGSLTLNNSTISGGSAAKGGAIYNAGVHYIPAYYNYDPYINIPGYYSSFGSLVLNNCVITGNSASTAGGGVFNGGYAAIGGGSFSKNLSPGGAGGAIYNLGNYYFGNKLTISYSLITGNTAARGGGVANGFLYLGDNSNYNGPAYMNISGGSFSKNTATNKGGAVSNLGKLILSSALITGNKAVDGGGIYNGGSYSDFQMTSGTLSKNAASRDGGGIFQTGGQALVTATITGNKATVNGGGVYDNSYIYFSGSITKNSAAKGGGVYDRGYYFNYNGYVTGNKAKTGANLFQVP